MAKAIRELCVFSVHSAIKDPPFSQLDLISCRNLLIYMNPDLQQRLLRIFHYALRPGAYLLLGPSESLARSAPLFAVLDKKQRLYQRRDEIAPSIPVFRSPARHRASAAAARATGARAPDG